MVRIMVMLSNDSNSENKEKNDSEESNIVVDHFVIFMREHGDQIHTPNRKNIKSKFSKEIILKA